MLKTADGKASPISFLEMTANSTGLRPSDQLNDDLSEDNVSATVRLSVRNGFSITAYANSAP